MSTGSPTPPSRWSTPPRPARAFRTGPVTRALIGMTWLVTAAAVVLGVLRYPSLPPVVPVHLGVTGGVDGYGSRSVLLWFLGIGVPVIAGACWVSRRPQLFNQPVPVTEENAQRLYRVGEQVVVQVALVMAVVLLGAVLLMTGSPGASAVLVVVTAVLLVVATVVGAVRAVRAARPAPPAP